MTKKKNSLITLLGAIGQPFLVLEVESCKGLMKRNIILTVLLDTPSLPCSPLDT